MISVFINCAKVWVRIVRAVHRLSGRPQVTLSRAPVPVRDTALAKRRAS